MALTKNPKHDIKLKYYRVFQISLILSLSLLILAFKFFPNVEKEIIDNVIPQVLIDGEDVHHSTQDEIIPAPPRPLIPVEAPSEDEFLEDYDILSTDLDVNANVGKTNSQPPKAVVDDEFDYVFEVVEQMPDPIGGIGAIQSKIVYPEIAKRAGVQGRVFVKAFVNQMGSVYKVELVRGIGAGCDEAAMEAVKNTMFNPGKQRGKPVKVQVIIPVFFKLQ
jgi:protein TonB